MGMRADGLAQLCLLPVRSSVALPKAIDGAALRPAAQREFLNDAGGTDQNHENEVGDQERHAPELLTP